MKIEWRLFDKDGANQHIAVINHKRVAEFLAKGHQVFEFKIFDLTYPLNVTTPKLAAELVEKYMSMDLTQYAHYLASGDRPYNDRVDIIEFAIGVYLRRHIYELHD